MNTITLFLIVLSQIFTPYVYLPQNTSSQPMTSVSEAVFAVSASVNAASTITPLQLATVVVSQSPADAEEIAAAQSAQTSEATPGDSTLKQVAKQFVDSAFGPGYFSAFDKLINQESSWNLNAVNPSSGAYGLGQALPPWKIKDRSLTGQLKWIVAYISDRYSTPAGAWNHEVAYGWY